MAAQADSVTKRMKRQEASGGQKVKKEPVRSSCSGGGTAPSLPGLLSLHTPYLWGSSEVTHTYISTMPLNRRETLNKSLIFQGNAPNPYIQLYGIKLHMLQYSHS